MKLKPISDLVNKQRLQPVWLFGKDRVWMISTWTMLARYVFASTQATVQRAASEKSIVAKSN